MGIALLHLVQGGVYAALAWELSRRWYVDAGLIGAAAVVQLVGVFRRPRLEPWLHLVSLALVLAVYARFAAVALHVERVFGPLTGQQAMSVLGASVAALPWVLAFPLVRLVLRPPGRVVALLPLALVPALNGLPPWPTHPGAEKVEALAGALYTRWAGGDAPVEPLPADARVRVTVLRAGVPREPVLVGGDAVAGALDGEAPPKARDALLVDVAEAELPRGLVRPGVDAPAESGRSPGLHARSLARMEILPGFFAPAGKAGTARWRTALASADGVVLLANGWAPGPGTLDTPTIDAALGAAAAHLAHGQEPDGRFTYIVKGPSGAKGSGYNYPRHAGTAWFLARVWAATGDPVARDAARVALAHLAERSPRTPDGRAYVLDPARDDGRAWIGTTALAVLAHTALAGAAEPGDDELVVAYVRQLAASVDARGKVLGDMRLEDATFFEQPANAYGQGQVMLALAAAERAGLTEGTAALDRAVRHLESGDYIGSAHPLTVGDEHWTCLAATAIRGVRGVDGGAGICDAYVANERWVAPLEGGGLVPATGPGAGAAEALVARAWDTRRPDLVTATYRWARAFLAAQYRPADAPLLGDPAALIGGFRDGVGQLDVQIDAVQHIGGALLGAEALLAGRARPGSLP